MYLIFENNKVTLLLNTQYQIYAACDCTHGKLSSGCNKNFRQYCLDLLIRSLGEMYSKQEVENSAFLYRYEESV